MNGPYGEPEQQPGYSAELLSIAQSACKVTYAAAEAHGKPPTRDDMYWTAARQARRRCRDEGYGIAPLLPLGLWLLLTVIGAFISWAIQRELDKLYPRETGASA